MQPLRAKVQNGRLILDEPTHLPEGDVVYLQPVQALVADGGDLDAEERAPHHRELEASLLEVDAGETEDFAAMLADLRQRA